MSWMKLWGKHREEEHVYFRMSKNLVYSSQSKQKMTMPILEKDAAVQCRVKSIASFHFYFVCLLVLILFSY